MNLRRTRVLNVLGYVRVAALSMTIAAAEISKELVGNWKYESLTANDERQRDRAF